MLAHDSQPDPNPSNPFTTLTQTWTLTQLDNTYKCFNDLYILILCEKCITIMCHLVEQHLWALRHACYSGFDLSVFFMFLILYCSVSPIAWPLYGFDHYSACRLGYEAQANMHVFWISDTSTCWHCICVDIKCFELSYCTVLYHFS